MVDDSETPSPVSYLATPSFDLFGGRRREKASASGILFGGSTRGRETEQLLNVLSNRHGAEDVEEDEGTVCHVIPRQIPVREALRGNKGEAW